MTARLAALALAAGLGFAGCVCGEQEGSTTTAGQTDTSDAPVVTGKRIGRGGGGDPGAAGNVIPPNPGAESEATAQGRSASEDRASGAVPRRSGGSSAIEGSATGSAFDRLGRSGSGTESDRPADNTMNSDEPATGQAVGGSATEGSTDAEPVAEEAIEEPSGDGDAHPRMKRSHGHAGTQSGRDAMDIPIKR